MSFFICPVTLFPPPFELKYILLLFLFLSPSSVLLDIGLVVESFSSTSNPVPRGLRPYVVPE